MLESVSMNNKIQLPDLQNIKDYISEHNEGEISVADSFVKNTVESAPILFGTSAALSYIDSKCSGVPFKKIFREKNKKVFIPVLIVTSLATAIFENYITDKTNNRNRSEK